MEFSSSAYWTDTELSRFTWILEQYELQMLQDAADRRLEARDSELLAQLDRFKHAVEQLPPDTATT